MLEFQPTNTTDYDPPAELSLAEAEAFLRGTTEDTPTDTREFNVRDISDTTIKSIQTALDHLRAMPEKPTE